ncbi:hypothetical protein AFSV47Ss_0172 [African swine fever virus]|nr:hypothetical protein AFSV47Ss_0172 [African swine fever virus]
MQAARNSSDTMNGLRLGFSERHHAGAKLSFSQLRLPAKINMKQLLC